MMMQYRYETHCHSSRCSRCAHSTPTELVKAYHEAGYAGLVLTDHFIHGNNCVDASLPWEQQMQCYYDAYLEAREAAKALDFDVIFGLEHAYGGGMEVLCYGIDLDFLLNNPDIPKLELPEFAKRVHEYGGILIHAHPYRWAGPELELPMEHLDGIEVFNCGNPPWKNQLAQEFANGKNLIQTSGGDTHLSTSHMLGTAGIALPYRLQTGKALVRALKKRDHSLIFPGQLYKPSN